MGILKSSGAALASYLVRGEAARTQPRSYGAIPSSPSLVPPLHPPSSPVANSPRRERSIRITDLEDVTEEEEDELEELVDTPYSVIIRNYTLVPISAILFICALIGLFTLCWPPNPDEPRSEYPYRPHWGDLLVGCAAWVVSYSLRIPIFLLCTYFGRFTHPVAVTLSTTFHILVEEALRLSSLVLLGIRLAYWPDHPSWVPFPDTQDDAFRRTFWFALGWAVVEVSWSISQGYEQLALYRDLLTKEKEDTFRLRDEPSSSSSDRHDAESISHRYVHSIFKSISPPEPSQRLSPNMDRRMDSAFDLEEEMNHLMRIQHRNELEMVYGVPPPNIPVFISILQRLDSILLTLGLTLTLASAYLSQLAAHPILENSESAPPVRSPPLFPPELGVNAALWSTMPTFAALVILHASLAIMWTEALPRIGVHTASYTALLVALGVFFAGLASWGALA